MTMTEREERSSKSTVTASEKPPFPLNGSKFTATQNRLALGRCHSDLCMLSHLSHQLKAALFPELLPLKPGPLSLFLMYFASPPTG